MNSCCVNRTKEGETLYYMPQAELLYIVPPEKKGAHFIYGSSAAFVYQKLAADTTKKVVYRDLYWKRFLMYLIDEIDRNSGAPFETMAALEVILEKITGPASQKGAAQQQALGAHPLQEQAQQQVLALQERAQQHQQPAPRLEEIQWEHPQPQAHPQLQAHPQPQALHRQQAQGAPLLQTPQ